MRVLLTGATGFIGAHVARVLVEQGAEVHGLTLPGAPRDRLDGIESSIQMHEGDLSGGAWARATILEIAPDAALHLAWYAEPGSYLRASPENMASLRAGMNVLAALAEGGKCRRVVVAGTCLENLATSQPTIYAASKAAQHQLAMGFTERGMTAACAHVHYLYGPWEDRRRVVPTVTTSLLRGQRVDLTSGSQSRDYLHVSDVAAALCRILVTDATGRVDVCTGKPVALRDVFDEIGRATGKPELLGVGLLPDSPYDGWPATGDPTALLATGWQPRYSLRQGIEANTAWWAARLAAER